ncbi:MAG: hypothetical protein JJU00_17550 [Opitutales bacterium]|nr:hypothetical protein [Opitutales bacterium]
MKRNLSTILAVSIAVAVFTAFSLRPVATLNAAFSGRLWFVAGTLLLLAVIAVNDWRMSAVRIDTMQRRRNPSPPAATRESRQAAVALTAVYVPKADRLARPSRRRNALPQSAKNHPAVISR